MEPDPNSRPKEGPPSRRAKVKNTQKEIQAIENQAQSAGLGGEKGGKAQDLTEACDIDERMQEVMFWSREEAKELVKEISELVTRKRDHKDDEHFIRAEVMKKFVKNQEDQAHRELVECGRKMRRHTKVFEEQALTDQETLAKYIELLEHELEQKHKERREARTLLAGRSLEKLPLSSADGAGPGEELVRTSALPSRASPSHEQPVDGDSFSRPLRATEHKSRAPVDPARLISKAARDKLDADNKRHLILKGREQPEPASGGGSARSNGGAGSSTDHFR